MSYPRFSAGLALLAAAGSAAAHQGHEAAGFLSGFAHPLGGPDHLLAMVAVGYFAARQAGRARWALPAGFMVAMLVAAGLGAALAPVAPSLPGLELGIAASVLILGLLIALLARLPLALTLPLVSVFALFHGFAHGVEMGTGSLLAYAAGFTLATGLLHGTGYLLARRLPEKGAWAQWPGRAVGGLIAGAGLLFLAG
jgi:urease accessory protein